MEKKTGGHKIQWINIYIYIYIYIDIYFFWRGRRGGWGKEEKNQESVSHGSPLISASARCSHSVSKIRPILRRPKQNKAPALVVRRSLLEAKFPLTSHSAERSRKDVMLWNL